MKLINPPVIFRIFAIIGIIVTVSFLVCILVACIYNESVMAFVWSAMITFLSSLIFYLISRKEKLISINIRESFLSVTLSWIVISLAGCLPYIISGTIPSFINAFFESTSGFTTTGSSILIDVESLPKSILFFRSLTHWIGGMGIILLVILILPSINVGGFRIFILESSLKEKFHPRIKYMGIRLLGIYLLLSITETILLYAGGMNLFESVCHTFGTVATGGFSPRNSSLASYSPYIQYIVMIFMFLSGMNFLLHYSILKLNFKKVLENDEFWFYLTFILISGSVVTGILFFKTDRPFEISFRESFFQVLSILTSTGFASSDYLLWPRFAYILIFLFMFMGACTGSTSGGIKMARHLLMLKNIRNFFIRLVSHNTILPVRINGQEISPMNTSTTLTFIFLYLSIFILGTVVIIVTGVDAETASSSVITCMGNIGPGIGTVGPTGNYSHIPETGKLLLSFFMITGRLEIYTVLIIFAPIFWKK